MFVVVKDSINNFTCLYIYTSYVRKMRCSFFCKRRGFINVYEMIRKSKLFLENEYRLKRVILEDISWVGR